MPAQLYNKSEEMKDIIKKLFEKRKDLFGEMQEFIYPEMISCVLRVDKIAPSQNKEVLKIKGITGVVSAITEIKYIIYGFESSWERCTYECKVAYVANMLRRIKYPTQDEINKLSEKGLDYEYGKTEKPDIHDFKKFIDAFGSGWSAGDIDNVPNLLEDTTINI